MRTSYSGVLGTYITVPDTIPTDRKYTGQREESALGLYYYNARWYDPALSHFIMADTIIPGAGNPQAWDRYAYTLNNPIRYNDPTGHRASDCEKSEAGCYNGEYRNDEENSDDEEFLDEEPPSLCETVSSNCQSMYEDELTVEELSAINAELAKVKDSMVGGMAVSGLVAVYSASIIPVAIISGVLAVDLAYETQMVEDLQNYLSEAMEAAENNGGGVKVTIYRDEGVLGFLPSMYMKAPNLTIFTMERHIIKFLQQPLLM